MLLKKKKSSINSLIAKDQLIIHPRKTLAGCNLPSHMQKTDKQLPCDLCPKKKKQKEYILLPVGGQYSLGLVVTGQPVDPALDENQAELGILVLQKKNHVILSMNC